jgi:beta-phosphoglucomutase-like phosphatase (HAD superfamily)
MLKTTISWGNDGVLVDTEILYYRANRQVLRGLGVELTLGQFR